MSKIADLRPSPIAGRGWYEGDPRKLARQVDEYLSQADEPELDGEVLALIAPHAGHIYSGATAGYAFRCVPGCHFDLVAVISPLHRGYPTSPLLTTAHQAYQTPLGAIPVDHQALFALAKALEAPQLKLAAVAYDEEHSLEIELPFLHARPDRRVPPAAGDDRQPGAGHRLQPGGRPGRGAAGAQRPAGGLD